MKKNLKKIKKHLDRAIDQSYIEGVEGMIPGKIEETKMVKIELTPSQAYELGEKNACVANVCWANANGILAELGWSTPADEKRKAWEKIDWWREEGDRAFARSESVRRADECAPSSGDGRIAHIISRKIGMAFDLFERENVMRRREVSGTGRDGFDFCLS